ncbi:long-chain-alcohol O-fatty-acyltransferase-like [Ananas comosus]|uniref:Long-chain-alcohol O-fatty-acyltransferase-like n=1 Tax=Ananas comosus TaxID=4615 RepID=A0A6P5EKX5_ANACO|nr:long-chain-alcohol O-fatty-acyltransferase-like [Ananas comosus]
MAIPSELWSLARVTVVVSIAMSYARFASSRVTPGALRLAALLPVISLLPLLPFSFSSITLRGTAGFLLAWLSLFKLLLLSFGLGPLHPSLPLLPFLLTSSLPVKLRSFTNTKQQHTSSSSTVLFLLSVAAKLLLYAFLASLYRFRDRMSPYLLLGILCFHIYVSLELLLALSAAAARGALGVELEPQANKPYLATSLGDFWGRRWNLMVSAALRPAVYHPVRARLGRAAGVVAAFLVSGLMHEAMFYYITLAAPPTGEVTAFFALHGLCTAAEGWWARRRSAAPAPPRWVAAPVTVGFVVGTGLWLFVPPLFRGGTDERMLEECMAMVAFVEETGRSLL